MLQLEQEKGWKFKFHPDVTAGRREEPALAAAVEPRRSGCLVGLAVCVECWAGGRGAQSGPESVQCLVSSAGGGTTETRLRQAFTNAPHESRYRTNLQRNQADRSPLSRGDRSCCVCTQ